MKKVRAKLIIRSLSILIQWEMLSHHWRHADKVYMTAEVNLPIPFQAIKCSSSNEFSLGVVLQQESYFNLSWIMSWKKCLNLFFFIMTKSGLTTPLLFQLLMRIHGSSSGKLLSFKPEKPPKIQINSHKNACKESSASLLCALLTFCLLLFCLFLSALFIICLA